MQLDHDEYTFLSRRGSVPSATRSRPEGQGAETDQECSQRPMRRPSTRRLLAQRLLAAASLTRAAATVGFQDRYRDL